MDRSEKVIFDTEQPNVAGVSHLWAYLIFTLIYVGNRKYGIRRSFPVPTGKQD